MEWVEFGQHGGTALLGVPSTTNQSRQHITALLEVITPLLSLEYPGNYFADADLAQCSSGHVFGAAVAAIRLRRQWTIMVRRVFQKVTLHRYRS